MTQQQWSRGQGEARRSSRPFGGLLAAPALVWLLLHTSAVQAVRPSSQQITDPEVLAAEAEALLRVAGKASHGCVGAACLHGQQRSGHLNDTPWELARRPASATHQTHSAAVAVTGDGHFSKPHKARESPAVTPGVPRVSGATELRVSVGGVGTGGQAPVEKAAPDSRLAAAGPSLSLAALDKEQPGEVWDLAAAVQGLPHRLHTAQIWGPRTSGHSSSMAIAMQPTVELQPRVAETEASGALAINDVSEMTTGMVPGASIGVDPSVDAVYRAATFNRTIFPEPPEPLWPPPAAVSEMRFWEQVKDWVMALGGGTGARLKHNGPYLDRTVARSMRMQDEVVLTLLLFVYFATLSVSAKLAYRQSSNNSRVTFYADQRYHLASCYGFELETFLEAFNTSPKGAYLRVTGYTPAARDAPGSFNWRGSSYLVDFSFSLDLSPWVMRGPASREVAEADVRSDGVVAMDLAPLEHLLEAQAGGNPLAIVQLKKEVTWSNWEELATNIKQQIRQGGFTGIINIDCTEQESMSIYRNAQWANFMHSKSFKVILALSIVGWAFYAPYMWLRCVRFPVRCLHHIDIEIGDYWPLIAGHLSAHGFDQNLNSGRSNEDTSSLDSRESGVS